MSEHPECLALLQGIIDDPADDTSRLVYADWLQENGFEDRAEFIRVGLEIAKFFPPTRVECLSFEDSIHNGVRHAVAITHLTLPIERRIDLVLLTSRLSAKTFPDWKVVTATAIQQETRLELLLEGLPPWPERVVYDNLLIRQYQLLCERVEDWGYRRLGPFDYGFSNMSANPSINMQFPTVRTISLHGEQIFRRGFVSEMRCRAEDWLLEGKSIVSQHPIESVVLTNTSPGSFTPDSGSGSHDWEEVFYWGRSEFYYPSRMLPYEIGIHLTGKWTDNSVQYSSRQAAIDDASRACLLFASSA